MIFPDHFSDASAHYAVARPHYPSELFAFIASAAPSTERVWDVGTGTGQAAVALAHHFHTVCASDPSAEQIAHTTQCANVEYSVQPAEATNYPDAAFDAVCVAQALHWFDVERFFPEVRRVLRPNGIFAAWGYAWFSVEPDFDAAFDLAIRQVIEPDWAPQNALLWNGYRDIPIPFAPIAVPEFTIRVRWNLYELLAYTYTWSATRRAMLRLGDDFLRSAEAVLTPFWGPPTVARDIEMPLYLRVGRYTAE